MKYNRTYHLPWSPGATSDDKIIDSVGSLLNRPIVITEKLDGENCAMTKNGVYARSHSTFTTSPWSKEVRLLHSIKVKDFLNDTEFIFGENMEGIHSIEYKNLTSYFYMFAIRNESTYLSWDDVEEFSSMLDIPTVPVLYKGQTSSEKKLKSIVEDLVNSESKLGGDLEGLVIRPQKSFDSTEFTSSVLKWVRPNHVKTNEHWTKSWRKHNIYKKNNILDELASSDYSY